MTVTEARHRDWHTMLTTMIRDSEPPYRDHAALQSRRSPGRIMMRMTPARPGPTQPGPLSSDMLGPGPGSDFELVTRITGMTQ